MRPTFNVYCDESCHLEHDRQAAMVLGALWCPLDKTREIARRLREIKMKHGLPPGFEVKWTKVGPGKVQLYLDLIDYFFDDNDLHFRALVVPDKTKLRHEDFGQDHDTWYYKMYFEMLKVIFDPECAYRIYLDVKDTRSANKVRKLHDVLCNSRYDFHGQIFERMQCVTSGDVEQIQLADLLLGTVSYANRGLQTSKAKAALVSRIRERSGYSLQRNTLLREAKFNVFIWRPREAAAHE